MGHTNTGFVIGQPAFAIAQNNETGFFWGRMDADPSQALPIFNKDPATGTQFMATAADAQGAPRALASFADRAAYCRAGLPAHAVQHGHSHPAWPA